MIKVNLMGGLGNQMFQFAAAYALSKRINKKVYLDLTFLKKTKQSTSFTKREFELNHLNIQNMPSLTLPLLTISKFIDQALVKSNIFQLISDANAEELLNPSESNYLLNGYFQSENYFKEFRKDILSLFAATLSPKSQEIIESIRGQNTVSVHVRRGDYITNSAASQFHGLCNLDYYKNALSHLISRVSIDKILIFSDDLDWCKNNFQFKIETLYVDHNKNQNSFEDIFIMKNCTNNIIANSSFSWWGAWLNENDSKVVIAPKNWFAGGLEYKNIIPNTWIII